MSRNKFTPLIGLDWENSILIKQEVTDTNKEKIRDYLDLVKALQDVIEKQRDDYSDEEIKESQEKFNEVYDNFSDKHGFINSLSNTRALKEDSNFPLISSIEILDDEDNFKAKGDIFSKRTIRKAQVVDHVDTSLEALVLSVSQKGYVDFDYMESITDKDKNRLIEELEGEIFLDIKAYDSVNNLMPFESFRAENEFHFNYVSRAGSRFEKSEDRLRGHQYIQSLSFDLHKKYDSGYPQDRRRCQNYYRRQCGAAFWRTGRIAAGGLHYDDI
jgi:hypothetical protein